MYTYTILPHTHILKEALVRMTIEIRVITVRIMQMLHTHEAVQASEGGCDEKLVGSQLSPKNKNHQKLYSQCEIDIL